MKLNHDELLSNLAFNYNPRPSIVLEIINSTLTYALPQNPEVVYALLHRQEPFEPFAQHPRFSELVENIQNVLAYFNRAMDGAGVGAGAGAGGHWWGGGPAASSPRVFTVEHTLAFSS